MPKRNNNPPYYKPLSHISNVDRLCKLCKKPCKGNYFCSDECRNTFDALYAPTKIANKRNRVIQYSKKRKCKYCNKLVFRNDLMYCSKRCFLDDKRQQLIV